MTHAALGRLVHARYVISGSYATQGDSLFLQAEVTDADSARRVLAITPVAEAIRAKQVALEQLRQRVTNALVPFFDSSIVTESRVPPRYEAYKEFLLGNELYPTDPAATIPHLRAAARLDSTFVLARIRLIDRLNVSGQFAARDSVIAEVESMRGALSPYEAAVFEIRVALARGNYHAAYVASENAFRLAPKSTWAAYELSEHALLNQRPGRVVQLLEPLDPQAGALRFSPNYYAYLCRAYHALERAGDMRRCYERARRQYPSNRNMMEYLLRVAGADRDVERVERMADSIAPEGGDLAPALFELEVHGRADRARAIAQRVLAYTRRPTVDSTRAMYLLLTRMDLLLFLGDWQELARLADSALQRGPAPWALGSRGVAAAMLGDTAGARRRVADLGAIESFPGDRARILAPLGDKSAVPEILQGMAAPAFLWQYHGDITYRLMRGYAPFEDFLKPRD